MTTAKHTFENALVWTGPPRISAVGRSKRHRNVFVFKRKRIGVEGAEALPSFILFGIFYRVLHVPNEPRGRKTTDSDSREWPYSH